MDESLLNKSQKTLFNFISHDYMELTIGLDNKISLCTLQIRFRDVSLRLSGQNTNSSVFSAEPHTMDFYDG